MTATAPDPAARRLPPRSLQVRATLFGSGVLVHDELRNQVSVLNLAGSLVWDACDGRTTVGELARSLGADLGEQPERLVPEIGAQLDQLEAAGLVGRPWLDAGSVPPFEEVTGAWATPPLRVLDASVVVRCHDRAVRDRLVEVFGHLVDGTGSGEPPGGTAELGVEATADGLRLYGRGFSCAFSDLDQFADAVASQLNRVATTSTGVLALHAAGVRAPDGRVVVLTGTSGAGKSTLVAALIRAGWDYLSDEAVGVSGELVTVGYPKPLALDASSRALLQLPVPGAPLVAPQVLRPGVVAVGPDGGPLASIVVLHRPDPPDPPVDLDRRLLGPLAPDAALAAVAPHLLNLTTTGQAGLESLAAIALQVPVWTMQEPDLHRSVDRIAALLP